MKNWLFLFLFLEGFVISFPVGASSALIPALSKAFSVSEFIAGKNVWFYMLAYGISALFYGQLAKIYSLRKIKLISFFFFSLASFFTSLAKNINIFLVGRFLMGVFAAMVIPFTLILVQNNFAFNLRGKIIGFFFAGTFLASLLGIFLSGLLNWRVIFLLTSIFSFFIFLLLFFKFNSFKEKKFISQNFFKNYIEVFKFKQTRRTLIYIFLISMFFHGASQWFSSYFSLSFNYPQTKISFLLTLVSLSGIVGELLGGVLSDYFGRFKILNLGIILMVIALLFFSLKLDFLILTVLSLILWGMGWTFNHVGISVNITDLGDFFVYELSSLNSSIRFFSGGLGMYLSKILMEKSFSFGFMTISFFLLILLIKAKYFLKFSEEEI